jgi:hypothetical protein
MKNRYLYFAMLLSFIGQAQIYYGTTSLGSSMTLDITMNTNTDSIDIEISGPSTGYYSIGFGNTGMNGTYILLVNSNGTMAERKLGQYNGGSVLTSSIAYSTVTTGSNRTAYIEGSRIGATANHYTFPANGGSVPLIWATGGTSFGNHGNANRGTGAINLTNQCNIPTTTLTTQTICTGDSLQIFGEWVSQPGTYLDTLVTPIGCDSLVAQEILVNTAVNSTIATAGLCAGDSVFYLDAWRTDTGTVVYNGVTTFGCDSTISGRVEYLPNVDTGSVWVAPYSDVSFYVGLDTGATFYWFNCNTGAFVDTTMGVDTINPGNEFLQAPDTGYYAAIIVKPGFCSDTSSCYYFYMDVPEYDYGISLRPIPATTTLLISLDNFSGPLSYEIISIIGKRLTFGTLEDSQAEIDLSRFTSGIYLLRFEDGRTMKFLKE